VSEWIRASLGRLTHVVGGTTPSTAIDANFGGDVVWVTPVDLGRLRQPYVSASARTITAEARDRAGLEMVPVGSVIMSSRAPIGHLAIAAVPLCTNQGCKSFVPGPEVDSLFLYYRLLTDMPRIRTLGAGATFAEVSKSDLAAFEISLPNIELQRLIAETLTRQLDAVGSAQKPALERHNTIRILGSRAYEVAFGGQIPLTTDPHLAEAASRWGWRTLTDLARLETGHTPSRSRPDWWTGEIPWIALPDIRRLDGRVTFDTIEMTNAEGIANSSARILPAGTVAMSRTASVGFVTRMGRPMATSQDFVNWVCGPDLDPEFLMHLLIRSRGEIRALSSGAIHKTVYMPTLKALRVCIPAIDEQRRIAIALRNQLAAIDAIEALIRAEQDAIDALPAALLRRALGKLAA
jgi:type I restriction enzyme S subunit